MLTIVSRFLARCVVALLISALLGGCDNVHWNVCVSSACRDEISFDNLCSFYAICGKYPQMKTLDMFGTLPTSYRCGDSMILTWDQPFIRINGFYEVKSEEMEGGMLDMDAAFECEDSEGRKTWKRTMKFGKQPSCCLP